MRKRLSIAFCTPEFLNLAIFMGKIRDTKANATLLQIVFRLLRLLFARLLEKKGAFFKQKAPYKFEGGHAPHIPFPRYCIRYSLGDFPDFCRKILPKYFSS